ncbi:MULTISPECIES: hypothetical protein [unclassified Streptomyces]|uniref:hypothetical protein n=1 Tax=unclassified Streptomyces TaxID=2593676 RepID=UPI003BB61C0E
MTTTGKTTAGVLATTAALLAVALALPAAAVAAPGEEEHPFSALERTHFSDDEPTAAATALDNRGPSGLPWLSGTMSVKVA